MNIIYILIVKPINGKIFLRQLGKSEHQLVIWWFWGIIVSVSAVRMVCRIDYFLKSFRDVFWNVYGLNDEMTEIGFLIIYCWGEKS